MHFNITHIILLIKNASAVFNIHYCDSQYQYSLPIVNMYPLYSSVLSIKYKEFSDSHFVQIFKQQDTIIR